MRADGVPFAFGESADACRALAEEFVPGPGADVVILGWGTGDLVDAVRARIGSGKSILVVEPFPEVADAARAASPRSVRLLDGRFSKVLGDLSSWASRSTRRLGSMTYLVHPALESLLLAEEFPLWGGESNAFWPWWRFFCLHDDANQPSVLLHRNGDDRSWAVLSEIWRTLVAVLPGVRTLYTDSPAPAAPASPSLLSIVVVTYRQPARLEVLLRTLAAARPADPWELIVVDNGGDEATSALLEAASASWPLTVVRSGENAGAIRGRNLGADAARGEILVFLDDDVVFHAPGWDLIVRKILDAHPRIGAVGAFGVVYGRDDSESFLQRFLLPELVAPVAWLSAYMVAVRRRAFDEAGRWDDRYGLIGGEDVGLGYQMRARGWISVAAPFALEPDYLRHAIAHRERRSAEEAEARRRGSEVFREAWGTPARLLDAARDNRTARDAD